jgi:hypothetical protein
VANLDTESLMVIAAFDNLDDLRLQHLVLYSCAKGTCLKLATRSYSTAQNETPPVGGMVGNSIDGIISTRRGNAGSWTGLIGKDPVGARELTLPNTEAMRNRFKDEEIDDILLVVTCASLTAAWPV